MTTGRFICSSTDTPSALLPRHHRILHHLRHSFKTYYFRYARCMSNLFPSILASKNQRDSLFPYSNGRIPRNRFCKALVETTWNKRFCLLRTSHIDTTSQNWTAKSLSAKLPSSGIKYGYTRIANHRYQRFRVLWIVIKHTSKIHPTTSIIIISDDLHLLSLKKKKRRYWTIHILAVSKGGRLMRH